MSLWKVHLNKLVLYVIKLAAWVNNKQVLHIGQYRQIDRMVYVISTFWSWIGILHYVINFYVLSVAKPVQKLARISLNRPIPIPIFFQNKLSFIWLAFSLNLVKSADSTRSWPIYATIVWIIKEKLQKKWHLEVTYGKEKYVNTCT